ncbi:MAG TPA: M20 family metallo-hydrolase [Nannocystaceae bacterium]|nr:M20 family metallo-hydrolase [Nannocystaceae bacterium]
MEAQRPLPPTPHTDLHPLRIDGERLLRRIDALAAIGALPGGGVCRLALTDEDRAGRDQVVGWMRELGLAVTVDRVGNVVGRRRGAEDDLAPVVTGSHIDTVRTGGILDGNFGVLAGLEVIARLNDAGITTRRPLAVAFFTNEEGARFAPDMMGSGVQQGALDLQAVLDTVGIDGKRVGDELARIGYAGEAEPGLRAHAFVELHIEQGPVLDREGITIGAVTGVQGISWTEVTLRGVSNHAGTTPIALRHDAGLVAAEIAVSLRRLALEIGPPMVATVGALTLRPNLVNVVANHAVLTLDLRHTDEAVLQGAEGRAFAGVEALAARGGVAVSRRTLARFAPVAFDAGVVDKVEGFARALARSVRRMPSGAGHDAQMFAPNCRAGMIFVPSVEGISHNVRERTEARDLVAGADVLLQMVLDLSA